MLQMIRVAYREDTYHPHASSRQKLSKFSTTKRKKRPLSKFSTQKKKKKKKEIGHYERPKFLSV